MPRMWTHPELGLIEVGDRDEAAAVCRRPMAGKTLRNYSYAGIPKNNPCPKPVTVNPTTRRDEWWLDQIRAWDLRRPGPGDHGGTGYYRRKEAATRGTIAEIVNDPTVTGSAS